MTLCWFLIGRELLLWWISAFCVILHSVWLIYDTCQSLAPLLCRHTGATVSQMNGCKRKPRTATTTATTASRQEIMAAGKENLVILLQGEAFAESTTDRSHPPVAGIPHFEPLWRWGHRCRGQWNQSRLEFHVYLRSVYGLYHKYIFRF